MTEEIYSGYVVLNHNMGIHTLELYRDSQGIVAWVDGDLCDDVESLEDFKEQYGSLVVDAVEVQGVYSIDEVWDEGSS